MLLKIMVPSVLAEAVSTKSMTVCEHTTFEPLAMKNTPRHALCFLSNRGMATWRRGQLNKKKVLRGTIHSTFKKSLFPQARVKQLHDS